MAQCSYCNSRIIIGGVRDGEERFCNVGCRQAGALLTVSKLVPDAEVRKRVESIHQGACPKCSRSSAVDVYTSHTVWSALVVTTWKSTPQMSCASCAKKTQLTAAVTSFFFGWWGFPWGLILTPIQVGRNIWELSRSRSSLQPSAQLERIVRLNLAAEAKYLQANAATPPPLKSA